MRQLRIAIIGAGASGTILAINLLRELKQPAEITLIEKDKRKLYRGAAYSSKLEYELLNVPIGKMSLFPAQPDDFYNWLNKNSFPDHDLTRGSFVSRRLYGSYLTNRIEEAVKEKHEDVLFKTILFSAVELKKEGNAYVLKQEDGSLLTADTVILATGNEAPTQVVPHEAVKVLGDKYISNPWVGDELPITEDILIIGTGLTMVDHVLSLRKRGHIGKIKAISRHGLLPKTHGVSVPYQLSTDISDTDFQKFYDKLMTEIEMAGQQNINWISVLDALRPLTPAIWKKFDDKSKREFLQHYKTKWDIHRHRIPAKSAEEIFAMLVDGQLEILQGTITEVEQKDKHFTITYRHSFTWQTEEVQTNRVINCTGPSTDYGTNGNILFKDLLNKGWLKKDDFEQGILTGERGEIIKEDGSALPGVYAIGPLRKASEWESTAIPEIRQQALQLAKLVIENYQPERQSAADGVLVRSR